MAALEAVRNGAIVKGIIPNQSVEIVSVDWIGEQALNVVYRVPGGSVAETTLYRDDEFRLDVEEGGRAWSLDADGSLLRRDPFRPQLLPPTRCASHLEIHPLSWAMVPSDQRNLKKVRLICGFIWSLRPVLDLRLVWRTLYEERQLSCLLQKVQWLV